MRIALLRFLVLVLTTLLISPATARADQWDFIYGDDPTNADNVSVFTEIRSDPSGGLVLLGYFFGTYEGLSSLGQYTRFIQRRSDSGVVQWTKSLPYAAAADRRTRPPEMPVQLQVDGDGTAFLSDAMIGVYGWYSIDKMGSIRFDSGRTYTYSATPNGIESSGDSSLTCHYYGTALRSSGLVRQCPNRTLVKVDKHFNTVWTADLSSYSDWSHYNDQVNTRITSGPADSIWFLANFNSGNSSQDQSQLPQSLRTAMSMVQFNGATGARIRAVKHYGMMFGRIGPSVNSQFVAELVGERNLWVEVAITPFNSAGGSTNLRVFNSDDGSDLGSIRTEWSSSRLQSLRTDNSYTAGSNPFCRTLVSDFGLTITEANSLMCVRAPNQIIGWGSLGLSNSTSPIGLWNECTANSSAENTCPVRRVVTADGRRLILAVGSFLAVMELSDEDIPEITRVITAKRFSGAIRSLATDALGNLFVVGSTFQSTVDLETSGPESSTPRAFVSMNPAGRLGLTVTPRTPLRVRVTGKNGVPAQGVGAVSLNLTVTSPSIDGFITVYPCGTRPEASNLNFSADQTVPNAVITPVSALGDVCFYSYAETHLLADVNGYFPLNGGFVATTPVRVFDTRATSAEGLRSVAKTPVGGPTEIRVKLTDLYGYVPARGIGAVSLNVTAVNPLRDGYVTVYPCGGRPEASNLNFVAGKTVPNAVITPVSASGEVCFYAYGLTDLFADLNGYFPAGSSGFVATNPVRVADTRADTVQGLRTVTKQKIGDATELRLKLTDLPGYVPASGVGAVSLNVTVDGTVMAFGGTGYLTVYPCGSRPNTSSLNFVNRQTVPNAVITPVSSSGEVCFYAYGTTDVIIDLNGYFPSGSGFVPVAPARLFDTR